jgi:excisionase family DNA binding protein
LAWHQTPPENNHKKFSPPHSIIPTNPRKKCGTKKGVPLFHGLCHHHPRFKMMVDGEINKQSRSFRIRLSYPNSSQHGGRVPREKAIRNLINVGEAAEHWGIFKHTLNDWISQRRIHFSKLGRQTRFLLAVIDAFINAILVAPRLRQEVS